MPDGTLVAVKALLANGEIARFGLRFAWTAGPGPTIPELEQLATAAQDDFITFDNLYCADLLMGLCTAQNFEHVPAVGLPPYSGVGEHAAYWAPTTGEVLSLTASVPGAAAGESASPQVASVVTLRTANSGRSRLGRVYTFPPPESVVGADGIVSDAGSRALMVESIAGAVMSESTGHGTQLEAHVFSATLNISTDIIQYVSNARVDTQRRRLQR